MPAKTTHNYLNNKDMLLEIHRSKKSYCDFEDKKYSDYDYILEDLSDLEDASIIQEAIEKRADRLGKLAYREHLMDDPSTTKKLSAFKVDPSTICKFDVVFRVMTYDHIPKDPDRKKNPKTIQDHHVKLNFPPFKHYVLINRSDEDAMMKKLKGEVMCREVGRSHTKDGEFCDSHGSITNKLARMFILLVNRYSQKANWRGYTYLDEMKGRALLQLSEMGLKFDESKSDNPFAYYTTLINNSFRRIATAEKKSQSFRDDLLIEAGHNPSYTRQFEIEEEIRRMRESADNDDTL